jgi:hypothetical protein
MKTHTKTKEQTSNTNFFRDAVQSVLRNRSGLGHKFIFLSFLFFSTTAFTQTFIAYSTGNWSSRSVWITTKSGTVTVASGSTTVTGSGTAFTTELQIGDKIYSPGSVSFSVIGTVASITSNTSLTLTAGASAGLSGSALYSNGLPSSSSDIQIGYNNGSASITLTVDGSYSCNLITFVQNNGFNYTLDIPASRSLSVAGTTYLTASSNNGNVHTVNVSGTFTTVNLYLQGANINSQNRVSQLTIQDGGVTNITGDIYIFRLSHFAKIIVSASGTGRLNLGGNFISTDGTVNGTTPYCPPPTITPGTAILVGTNNFASTSTLNFNGVDKLQVVPITANTVYGNLYFNNTGNNVATLNGNVTTSNALGNFVVQSGVFTNQGASSSTILNDASSSYTISGNSGEIFEVDNGAILRLAGSSTFPSALGTVTLQPTSTVEYIGGTQTISPQYYGNLTISAGTSVGRSVTLSNSGIIGVYTSFSPSASNNYTITGSTIAFDGNQSQTFPSGFLTYNNLTINNTSSTQVALAASITVNSTLNLANGKLSLGSYNLTIATSGSVSGASANSYIVATGSGTLIQQVAAGGSKTFPVGLATAYAPVTVAFTAGSVTDDISLRMLGAVYSNGETGTASTSAAVAASWIITEGAPGGSNATVTVQWPASLELSGFTRSSCRLGHYTAGAWDYGTSDIAASGSNPYTASRSGFTSFSPFSMTSFTPVPVKWVSFSGKNEGDNNYLQWQTVNETNNQYFIVESSSNGTVFSEVGRINGAINSSEIQTYGFVHYNAGGQTSYYRIRQIDVDGQSSYSRTIKIGRITLAKLSVLFNNNTALITIESASAKQVCLNMANANGQLFYKKVLSLSKGNNSFHIDLSRAAAGFYIIQLVESNGMGNSLKFIKQ